MSCPMSSVHFGANQTNLSQCHGGIHTHQSACQWLNSDPKPVSECIYFSYEQLLLQQHHANAQIPEWGELLIRRERAPPPPLPPPPPRRACTAVSTKDSGSSGSSRSDPPHRGSPLRAQRAAATGSDTHPGEEPAWRTMLQLSLQNQREV
ncbi:unnamed protein product [Pleuronectes platessa]|uniref:Uncharacterized protein n=1 Tax=Pleuronectes platessa TaxID=8262 RepID=A0A9N7YQ12_PLEPL|nr:unnamed protein product [Pleuronectes platessa]